MKVLRPVGTLVTALALTAGLWAAGPATAEAATPKLRQQTVTTTFTTPVGAYTYTYKKPVLSGVKKSVKKQLDSQIAAFFGQAISRQKAADRRCVNDYDPADPGSFDPWEAWRPEYARLTGQTEGGIYGKRYLSIHLEWSAFGCENFSGIGNDKWLNIDLKTGKPVKLSKFVNNKGSAFDYAVGIAIAQQGTKADGGTEEPCWSGVWCFTRWPYEVADRRWPGPSAWKRIAGWTVDSKGVKVYFRLDGGTLAKYRVPWNSINKAGVKLRKTTTKAVPEGDGPGRYTVVQEGRLVTVKRGSAKWVGIRPAGSKTARLFMIWQGQYTPGFSVQFRSKTSSRAVAAFVEVYLS